MSRKEAAGAGNRRQRSTGSTGSSRSPNPRKRGEPAAMERRVNNLVKQVKEAQAKGTTGATFTPGYRPPTMRQVSTDTGSKGKGVYRRGGPVNTDTAVGHEGNNAFQPSSSVSGTRGKRKR